MSYDTMYDTLYAINLHHSTEQYKRYLKERRHMSVFKATRKHYNAAGVHPTTDPDNPRSQFAIDRYGDHLRKRIRPGMRALDLGCNAGRFTRYGRHGRDSHWY